MPLAADRLLLPPGWRVTRMALKWSGVSTTLGSLVAATIVRVIAGALGVVCADAESARAVEANSIVPNVIVRTGTSLVGVVGADLSGYFPDDLSNHYFGIKIE